MVVSVAVATAAAGVATYLAIDSARQQERAELATARSQLQKTRLDLQRSESQLTAIIPQFERLRSETRKLRMTLEKRTERLLNATPALKAAEAILQEALLLLGAPARVASGVSCRARLIPEVGIKILSPREGQKVNSPVLLHLFVDDPVGCDATYFLTVDDIVYQPVVEPRRGPLSAEDPRRARPVPGLPRSAWTRHCGTDDLYAYWLIQLSPGPHTIRVNGSCPQGTNVPNTHTESVSFIVN